MKNVTHGISQKIAIEKCRELILSIEGTIIQQVKYFGGSEENQTYSINWEAVENLENITVCESINPDEYQHVVGLLYEGTDLLKSRSHVTKYFVLHFG